ncbi:hypothetical protein QJS04_geneDACA010779 [Acorus gramineus]|uniref:Uncharacterized protein n=1 Tax=Acorus gramineus TaxID=55184 RepID=A0AAV9B8J2_ACOGR|nr:hypothetical protein QJS04_geneDACA010779 [Acorus gramineus]
MITLRTQSMPSMPSEVPVLPTQQPSLKQQHRLRRTSKLSRSLNRLVRMVFQLKPGGVAPFLFEQHHERGQRRGNLATIPEVAEKRESTSRWVCRRSSTCCSGGLRQSGSLGHRWRR